MFPVRRIGGFFLRLVLAYSLLIAAWLVVGGAYSATYRAVGNIAFRSFGQHGKVIFMPLPQGDGKMDTLIHVINERTRYFKPIRMSTRRTGYVLTAAIFALIFATPLPWSRRWKALLLGWILAYIFVAFQLTILILYGFSRTGQAALFAPSPFWDAVLSAAYNVPATFSFEFAAPIVVWILATFRRGDLNRILQESTP